MYKYIYIHMIILKSIEHGNDPKSSHFGEDVWDVHVLSTPGWRQMQCTYTYTIHMSVRPCGNYVYDDICISQVNVWILYVEKYCVIITCWGICWVARTAWPAIIRVSTRVDDHGDIQKYRSFLKLGYPKMDSLWGKIPLKRMIWGYPHFRKPPYILIRLDITGIILLSLITFRSGW